MRLLHHATLSLPLHVAYFPLVCGSAEFKLSPGMKTSLDLGSSTRAFSRSVQNVPVFKASCVLHLFRLTEGLFTALPSHRSDVGGMSRSCFIGASVWAWVCSVPGLRSYIRQTVALRPSGQSLPFGRTRRSDRRVGFDELQGLIPLDLNSTI
ncbi:hypothetical protein U1Q18_014812 [Sarracenia purpurea var. burkii]